MKFIILIFINIFILNTVFSLSVIRKKIFKNSSNFTREENYKEIVILPEKYRSQYFVSDIKFNCGKNVSIINVHKTKRGASFILKMRKEYMLAQTGMVEVELKLSEGNSEFFSSENFQNDKKGFDVCLVKDPYNEDFKEIKEIGFFQQIKKEIKEDVDKVIVSVQLNWKNEPVAYYDIMTLPPTMLSKETSGKFQEIANRNIKYIKERKILNSLKASMIKKLKPPNVSVSYNEIFSIPSDHIQSYTPKWQYLDLEEFVNKLEKNKILSKVIFDIKFRNKDERKILLEWITKLDGLYGLTNIISSFDEKFLIELKNRIPYIKTGLETTKISDNIGDYQNKYNFIFFSEKKDFSGKFQINKNNCAALKQNGLKLGMWNIINSNDNNGYFMFYMNIVFSSSPLTMKEPAKNDWASSYNSSDSSDDGWGDSSNSDSSADDGWGDSSDSDSSADDGWGDSSDSDSNDDDNWDDF